MNFMKDISWANLDGVSPAALVEARRQSHNAVQWLARFSRSYLPPSPDDSHTSLSWNHVGDSFDTGSVEIGGNNVNLSFDFSTLSIAVVAESGTVLSRIDLPGLSDTDVERELSAALDKAGFSPGAFQKDLPYDLGDVAFTKDDRYDLEGNAQGLSELARYFANADSVLGYIASLRSDASDVGCWPHHFDIATLVTIEANDDPEQMKSVGLGLSPGDQMIETPYFYVTPWPYPDAEKLPPLPDPAYWHTEGFTAAIIPSAAMQGDNAATGVSAILGEAIRHCEELLKN